MRFRNLMVLVLTLVALCTAVLPVGAQSDADVVKSFKQYVGDYLASYQNNRREYVGQLGGGWAKMYFVPGEPSIDVRKTDSLVSPYLGVLEFAMIKQITAFHKTRAEAEADNTFTQSYTTNHRHTYAFQDGAWHPKSFQCSLVGAGAGDWLDCEQPSDGL